MEIEEISKADKADNSDKAAANEVLDLTGMRCPLPVIKLKRHIKKYGAENLSILKVKTTDPDSVPDFAELSRILNISVCYVEDSGVYLFTFRFAG